MSTDHRSPIHSRQVVNLWYQGGRSDKVYRLEIQEIKGSFEVFSCYGRRGHALRFHLYGDALSYTAACLLFREKLQEKLRKGYLPIHEDVGAVRQATPTRIS